MLAKEPYFTSCVVSSGHQLEGNAKVSLSRKGESLLSKEVFFQKKSTFKRSLLSKEVYFQKKSSFKRSLLSKEVYFQQKATRKALFQKKSTFKRSLLSKEVFFQQKATRKALFQKKAKVSVWKETWQSRKLIQVFFATEACKASAQKITYRYTICIICITYIMYISYIHSLHRFFSDTVLRS